MGRKYTAGPTASVSLMGETVEPWPTPPASCVVTAFPSSRLATTVMLFEPPLAKTAPPENVAELDSKTVSLNTTCESPVPCTNTAPLHVQASVHACWHDTNANNKYDNNRNVNYDQFARLGSARVDSVENAFVKCYV